MSELGNLELIGSLYDSINRLQEVLDAERSEHAKEIADLQQRIEELDQVCHGFSTQALEDMGTIDFLRQRIRELEIQLQDSQPSEPQHYKP